MLWLANIPSRRVTVSLLSSSCFWTSKRLCRSSCTFFSDTRRTCIIIAVGFIVVMCQYRLIAVQCLSGNSLWLVQRLYYRGLVRSNIVWLISDSSEVTYDSPFCILTTLHSLRRMRRPNPECTSLEWRYTASRHTATTTTTPSNTSAYSKVI